MFYMVFVGYIWLHLLYLIWFVLRSVLRWLPRKSLCGLGWHTHTATMSTLLYHFCRECAWQPQWLKERDVPQQGLRKVLLLTDHAMGGRHSCSKEREGCWRGNQIYQTRFCWEKLWRDLFMAWCLTLFCQVSSSSCKLGPLPLHLLSTLYFPWSHLPVCLLFRFHALWPFLPIVPEQRLYQDSNGREILFVCCCHRNATLVVRLAMKYIEEGWYLIANIIFLLPVKKESSDRQM